MVTEEPHESNGRVAVGLVRMNGQLNKRQLGSRSR